MASVALSVALFAGAAAAQSSTVGFAPTPLIDLVYPRPSDAPYQVFDFNGHDIYTRGYQSGYNICNSTTEGDSSLCQTMVQNSIMGQCSVFSTPAPVFGAASCLRRGLVACFSRCLAWQTSVSGPRPR